MAPIAPPGPALEPQVDSLLVEKLASALPKGYKFGIYHLSSPPTRTEALCSAPPDARPDRTYCENHFLAVSIDAEAPRAPEPNDAAAPLSSQKQTLVLALEVFVYTTAYSTILFVSKADSTGYLELLRLPKGTPSPIREVAAAFLSFLLEHRRRPGVQAVVSLFARSQPQYLFPRSVENGGKHVLDDRGLVKWWCRVLDPLLEEGGREKGSQKEEEGRRALWRDVAGYLIIPGLDDYETRAFLPRRSPAAASRWKVGHPLERISHYTAEYDHVPARCLIARYPDDPKSRFRDELDEEAASWMKDTGSWKSVRTLDQFWDMMAFRQECSSGRLTGFIWVVFDPDTPTSSPPRTARTQTPTPAPAPLPTIIPPSVSASDDLPPEQEQPLPSTPRRRARANAASAVPTSPSTPSKPSSAEQEKKKQKKKPKKLTGRIVPRQPHIKTRQRNYLLDRPVSTAYYYWPPAGRGEKTVDESDYKRIVEHLMHLDFSTLPKACASTKRWVGEAGLGAATWGREVVGARETPAAAAPSVEDGSGSFAPMSTSSVNNLSGLVKRKRPADAEGNATPRDTSSAGQQPVNVLGAGLVRRKQRQNEEAAAPSSSEGGHLAAEAMAPPSDAPKVNVLGAGLVRKKPKPAKG